MDEKIVREVKKPANNARTLEVYSDDDAVRYNIYIYRYNVICLRDIIIIYTTV